MAEQWPIKVTSKRCASRLSPPSAQDTHEPPVVIMSITGYRLLLWHRARRLW